MVKIYVEGGGDAATLKTACRAGFSAFLEKAGLKGSMPKVIPCGGRQDAYDSFCIALRAGDPAILLVDSEALIPMACQSGNADARENREKWSPWQHLQQRQGDEWEKPINAEELDCHLMAQCMESWLISDRQALKAFFGQGFRENQLPAAANPVESVPKQQLYDSLAMATRECKTKSQYSKGNHSFQLLANIDPAKVMKASPWALRFIEALKSKMGV